MEAMQTRVTNSKLHRRTTGLIVVAILLLLFDVVFVMWRSKMETPSFYVDLEGPVYVDRTSVSPRFPVWRNGGWYADGNKRISGHDLLSLEKKLSPESQCIISYELADNATLADFKASIKAAWITANSAMIVAPSAYQDIEPNVMAFAYAAPDREWVCPRPPTGS
jgi:hypothetical protein